MTAAFDEKEKGRRVNSGRYSGLSPREAIAKRAGLAEEKGFGSAETIFRLKDWGISRQRYWGTPIPVVYCEKDGIVPVPDSDLPVVLPDSVRLTGEGGSPLAATPEFVNTTCPKCGGPAQRETDTMDTFVDSSWYFYRYCDPQNDKAPYDSTKIAYWFPIDQYIGGITHAILHLLYSRFWCKVMRDLGLINHNEPIARLVKWRNEIDADEPLERDVRREVRKEVLELLTLMLAPMTPHLAEELWEMLGHAGGLSTARWPAFDEGLAREDEVEIPVQVNGRLRGRVKVAAGAAEEDVVKLARADAGITPHRSGKRWGKGVF